jgi:hypothetical protein
MTGFIDLLLFLWWASTHLAMRTGRAYLCGTNSLPTKDCFYTEALRDRLDEAPATPATRGTVPTPDHIKTSCRGLFA